jgi:hypothetical protein
MPRQVRLASEVTRMGAPGNAIESIVIDRDDRIVQRPAAH